MRLSHQLEQYILGEQQSTVQEMARWFGVSESRCRAELMEIEPFGVRLTDDDRVLLTC